MDSLEFDINIEIPSYAKSDTIKRLESDKKSYDSTSFDIGRTWFTEFLNRKLLQTHKDNQIVKDFIEFADKWNEHTPKFNVFSDYEFIDDMQKNNFLENNMFFKKLVHIQKFIENNPSSVGRWYKSGFIHHSLNYIHDYYNRYPNFPDNEKINISSLKSFKPNSNHYKIQSFIKKELKKEKSRYIKIKNIYPTLTWKINALKKSSLENILKKLHEHYYKEYIRMYASSVLMGWAAVSKEQIPSDVIKSKFEKKLADNKKIQSAEEFLTWNKEWFPRMIAHSIMHVKNEIPGIDEIQVSNHTTNSYVQGGNSASNLYGSKEENVYEHSIVQKDIVYMDNKESSGNYFILSAAETGRMQPPKDDPFIDDKDIIESRHLDIEVIDESGRLRPEKLKSIKELSDDIINGSHSKIAPSPNNPLTGQQKL